MLYGQNTLVICFMFDDRYHLCILLHWCIDLEMAECLEDNQDQHMMLLDYAKCGHKEPDIEDAKKIAQNYSAINKFQKVHLRFEHYWQSHIHIPSRLIRDLLWGKDVTVELMQLKKSDMLPKRMDNHGLRHLESLHCLRCNSIELEEIQLPDYRRVKHDLPQLVSIIESKEPVMDTFTTWKRWDENVFNCGLELNEGPPNSRYFRDRHYKDLRQTDVIAMTYDSDAWETQKRKMLEIVIRFVEELFLEWQKEFDVCADSYAECLEEEHDTQGLEKFLMARAAALSSRKADLARVKATLEAGKEAGAAVPDKSLMSDVNNWWFEADFEALAENGITGMPKQEVDIEGV